jgi:hypothetical protein
MTRDEDQIRDLVNRATVAVDTPPAALDLAWQAVVDGGTAGSESRGHRRMPRSWSTHRVGIVVAMAAASVVIVTLPIVLRTGHSPTVRPGSGLTHRARGSKPHPKGSNPHPTASHPTCQSAQLRLSTGFYGEAGGEYTQTLSFSNVSRPACQLSGWPSLQAVNASGRRQQTKTVRVRQSSPPQPAWSTVILRPGGSASFDVYGEDWDAPSDRACPKTSAVAVVPPHAISSLSVPVRIPDCGATFWIAPIIGGTSDRQQWSTAVALSRDSHVSGSLLMAGGPAGFVGRRVSGSVTLTNRAGEKYVTNAQRGRWAITVPPGSYAINGQGCPSSRRRLEVGSGASLTKITAWAACYEM